MNSCAEMTMDKGVWGIKQWQINTNSLYTYILYMQVQRVTNSALLISG